MRELPTGTVTFLFSDVEGSTKLLHSLRAEEYAEALAEHRRVIRKACVRHDGVEVDTQGDAFFFAFPTAPGAIAAAREMTEELAPGPIQVRIGLHTGTPLLTDEGYVGDDVHFAARVAASSHGGQVVVSAATAEHVEVSLTDLGEHRLKDIEEAVSIFQLGDGSFPPLKTISNTNLPRPASSFVGREAELSEVLSRIEGGARLVTLTGPGGSGKTRLALEAAASLVPFYKAGVFWVGLAALRDPALVMETISQTLGAKDGLVEHIAEREMLILLDNLEQVIEVAPELSALLSACPHLTVLVTSRELLRVQGEVEYAVPPLAEPEAVSLFCERAQLDPSEVIAELCARLDNLPLAVELAAARTKALSQAQILERISQRLDLLKGGRDAHPRQQTLRATIEWSYDLLPEEEQQLFARLSVFAGGCTLEAAEDVASADLNTLQSLVEKNLLRFSNERYWLLETIREYAAERLEESGDASETRQRHSEHFLMLVKGADEGIRTSAAATWLDLLDREDNNLRVTLAWTEQTGHVDRQLDLIACIWRFWLVRGAWHEGLRWVESGLGRSQREPGARRAHALRVASIFAHQLGDLERARAHAGEALSIQRELGDPAAITEGLIILGLTAADQGDYEEAERLYEESAVLGRGDARKHARAVSALGDLALRQGNYARAMMLTEEALALFRDRSALQNLALCLLHTGREREAVSPARESLALAHRVGDVESLIHIFVLLGSLATRRAEADVGARLVGAAGALREEVGLALTGAEVELHRNTVEELRRMLGDEHFEKAIEEGRRLTLDKAVEYAFASID